MTFTSKQQSLSSHSFWTRKNHLYQPPLTLIILYLTLPWVVRPNMAVFLIHLFTHSSFYLALPWVVRPSMTVFLIHLFTHSSFSTSVHGLPRSGPPLTSSMLLLLLLLLTLPLLLLLFLPFANALRSFSHALRSFPPSFVLFLSQH